MKLLHHTRKYTLTGEKDVKIQVRDNKIYKINNRKTPIEIRNNFV